VDVINAELFADQTGPCSRKALARSLANYGAYRTAV